MAVVVADDGLPAEVVGPWAKEKHAYLCRYLDASRGARKHFLGPGKAGATFVDLFCAFGRSNIRDTPEFIDGSSLAAWKTSAGSYAPFSEVFIADVEDDCRRTCAKRLSAVGAPVRVLAGDAVAAAAAYRKAVNPAGLHLAFLDPHNLGALDFQIIEELSKLNRIDMLIHVSAMDMQRNMPGQRALSDAEAAQFDVFAPGWRKVINRDRPQATVRAELLTYWEGLVRRLGISPFTDSRMIRGTRGQRLYWLMLASRAELAQSLWKRIGASDGQGALF